MPARSRVAFAIALAGGILTIGGAAPAPASAQGVVRPTHGLFFTNPIAARGQDPWVIHRDGFYYYCRSISGNRISVSRASHLPLIDHAERSAVWSAPPGTPYSHQLWAPELHYLRGRWYIYVAADDGDNANHRMFVLEGTTQDPRDPFEFRGQITDPTDRWAIDGTVLELTDGDLYFIWSGWEGEVNVQQNLYIAPMSDPLTISGERSLISEPEHSWERVGRPWVNEGPEVLISPDGESMSIIYSASGSWTDDYCLGRLTWTGGDVTDRSSWIKHPEPVFARTDNVFGPGHASFVTSHRGAQNWIIYHAARRRGSGWDRNVRLQRFTWDESGAPNFGEPVPAGAPLRWGWER